MKILSRGLIWGGFLSQYELYPDAGSKEALQQHFETFITEDNIKQIASWGFDHVRIPVGGWLFLDKEKKILRGKPRGVSGSLYWLVCRLRPACCN